jgi:signal recognition particle GTPase
MDRGFTLDDFMSQMGQVKRLGLMGKVMGMIPGMRDLTKNMGINEGDVESQMGRMRAIYDSMSRKERENTDLLDGPRRRRVARGAGVAVNEVSQFVKQFQMTREILLAIRSRERTDRPRLVLGLATNDPTRRDPSWVHRFAPHRSPGALVGGAIVAALVALGAVVFLYQLTR